MRTYAVIYEQAGDGGWGARAEDLPVYAAGDTREDAEAEIRSAIALYLEVLAEEGQEIPEPRSLAGNVTV